VRNFTEANLQIKCPNLLSRNTTENREKVQNSIVEFKFGKAEFIKSKSITKL